VRSLSRFPAPVAAPWGRPRHERLLLVLLAVGTLTVIHPPGAQDTSRMCLTQAVAHGQLTADTCLAGNVDRAEFAGHLYPNKAPGLSLAAVPAAEVVRLRPPSGWHRADLRLWAVRVATGGLALLACALLLGRLAEGLAPGFGGVTLATFAAGTLMASLAVDNFGEVPTAALGFAAFLLAWRGRFAAAGLAAGLAVLFEYQAALIALVVGVYVVLSGIRALGRYACGLAPGVALLGAYNWAAFGSPLHVSYRYVSAQFATDVESGFFGISAPSWHAIRLVLIGSRGLLVHSPVLILAAMGLVVLWRRGMHAEGAVCAFIAIAFLILEFGYFAPYGGDSPGPRYFVPALPFLAVGLAPAFARWRAPAVVLAFLSVLASTAVLLTWPSAVNAAHVYRWSVWPELVSFVARGSSSELASWGQETVFGRLGIGRAGGAGIVLAAVLAGLAVGVRDAWGADERSDPGVLPSTAS
jgi:hypothetical protein